MAKKALPMNINVFRKYKKDKTFKALKSLKT
jgi:hypothetical protein